ncbi:MAG TPA: hypothetical protein VF763_13685 [Candidatus Limnocylindrales bacterium]
MRAEVPRRARRCTECHDTLLHGRFDAAFRRPDGSELLALDLDAWVCRGCQQLLVDPALVASHGLVGVVCTMAIEAESVIVARAAAAEA